MNELDSCFQSFRILLVIPTLGERLETLERALSSIREQSNVLVDIVIVAKIAPPILISVADFYGARIIVHEGHISSAINLGFDEACEAHKYVGWIGDDDMLRSNALANACVLLERNTVAVVAYGACDYIDRDGKLLFSRRPPPMAPTLLQFIPGLIKQEACLFRLDAVRRVGGLDEKLKYTMDLDLLLKLRRLGPFVRADRVQAAFCWHPCSLTIANRSASLAEAQEVQNRNAQGIVKIFQTVWRYPVRYLIHLVNWIINKNLKNEPSINSRK